MTKMLFFSVINALFLAFAMLYSSSFYEFTGLLPIPGIPQVLPRLLEHFLDVDADWTPSNEDESYSYSFPDDIGDSDSFHETPVLDDNKAYFSSSAVFSGIVLAGALLFGVLFWKQQKTFRQQKKTLDAELQELRTISNLEKELANLRLQLDSKEDEAATLNEKLELRDKKIRLLHSTAHAELQELRT